MPGLGCRKKKKKNISVKRNNKVDDIKDAARGVILLCGIPGSGKTESGRLLAEILGISFYDLDEIIVQMSGKTVLDIFAQDGEAGFRDLEVGVLSDLLADKSPKVIALGGGTLESGAARKLVRVNPVVLIWLKVDITEAARHLEAGGIVDKHPLLTGSRGTMLIEALLKLTDTRSGNYSLSDFAVDTDGHTPEDIAAFIAQELDGKRA